LGRPFVRGLFSDGVDRMATVADTPVQILGSQARDEGSNVAAADVDDGKKLGPHSDVQDSEIPPAITMLHGVEVPPSSAGGNTYFTNLYDAYELLDEVMRRKLRRASWRPASTQATAYGVGMQAAKNDVAARGLVAESKVCHPVIRTHPVTLRKALWISTFTQEIYGLPEEDDAEAVLALLKEHVNAPERWYRHEWRAQDVLFWDNRCMNHWREGWDPALRRTVHRSQADGSRPF
jgi:taurine dioxygenase